MVYKLSTTFLNTELRDAWSDVFKEMRAVVLSEVNSSTNFKLTIAGNRAQSRVAFCELLSAQKRIPASWTYI